MIKTVIGRCSLCGGRVVASDFWHQVGPIAPWCDKCGATRDTLAGLPVIPMTPRDNQP